MVKLTNMIFIFIVTALIFGCSGSTTPDNNKKPLVQLTASEKEMINSTNSFGLKIFNELNKTDSKENIFISPLSISMALGMTYNGADGTTRETMQKTLELSGLSIEEVNQSYRNLINLFLELDPKVAMELANSIWYREGFTVENAFLELNKNYFDAVVRALDFANPLAKDIINGWISDKTHGKIKDVIKDINPMTVMFLINAIYFKGDWKVQFDTKNTKDGLFQNIGGDTKSVKMMVRKDSTFSYFENDHIQAIDLPYGAGDYSMVILLPKDKYNVESLIQDFSSDNWNQWLTLFKKREGLLTMPKFKIEYFKSLKEVLIAMGMGIAFIPNEADFTNINKNGDLYIGDVIHKSFVEVNEEGTEAAAVTIVDIRNTSVGSEFYMTVNRPFVFVIRESRTNTILFMGKVCKLGD